MVIIIYWSALICVSWMAVCGRETERRTTILYGLRCKLLFRGLLGRPTYKLHQCETGAFLTLVTTATTYCSGLVLAVPVWKLQKPIWAVFWRKLELLVHVRLIIVDDCVLMKSAWNIMNFLVGKLCKQISACKFEKLSLTLDLKSQATREGNSSPFLLKHSSWASARHNSATFQ